MTHDDSLDDLKAALLKPVPVDEWLIDFWRVCHAARGLAGLAGYTAIEVALLVLADGTGLTGAVGDDEVYRIIRCAMRDEQPFAMKDITP